MVFLLLERGARVGSTKVLVGQGFLQWSPLEVFGLACYYLWVLVRPVHFAKVDKQRDKSLGVWKSRALCMKADK